MSSWANNKNNRHPERSRRVANYKIQKISLYHGSTEFIPSAKEAHSTVRLRSL